MWGKQLLNRLNSWLGYSSRLCEKIGISVSILYGIIVFLLVFSGVLLRAGFTLQANIGIDIIRPFPWSEELARWFLIGIALISSSVAYKRGEHVGIELIVERFPAPLKRIVTSITDILVIIFMIVCLLSSLQVAFQAWNQTGDVIPFSMFWVKLNIPVGFGFMLVHAFSHFVSQMIPEERESI